MEATELRIGNYNMYNGKLDRINDGYDIDHVKNNDEGFHQPIKLTEEWLLKFGFRKMVTQDKHPTFLREGIHWNDGIIYVSQLGFLNHIKSVHQLQNLYHALTGKELTLKTE